MASYTITEKCINCGLCAEKCPVGAIQGTAEAGYKIASGLCIRCGLCGRLCSRGAVLDDGGVPVTAVAGEDWMIPYIYRPDCRDCGLCAEVCPSGCITTRKSPDGNYAAVQSAEQCIGCGLCAEACPVGIIQMRRRDDRSLHPEELMEYKEISVMNKILCRGAQLGLKLSNYVLKYRTPETLEGPGCLTRLPEVLTDYGVKNALLVTGPNITRRGLNKGLIDAMAAADIGCTVFNDIASNPTSDAVEAGWTVYKENKCDAIIAFGGGSPMDCAKAIAARLVRPGKSVAQLQGLLKVRKKIPPFFAIPTTAGTGSEATIAAVITDSATHHKASINDPVLMPLVAVLDPELTVSLPPRTTGTTGMDALCHAVEAYTNHTYNTKLEDDLARQAVKLIYDNLLNAYRNGSDMEARQNMQKAAFYAGRAFTRGCVGYVHAVGHTMSALYGMAHGETMAIILPHVLRQYGHAVDNRLAELAEVCGIEGDSAAEKAEGFIHWIEQCNQYMDIPQTIDALEVRDVPQIIAWAMREANPLYPVPVIWGERDFRLLLDGLQTKK